MEVVGVAEAATRLHQPRLSPEGEAVEELRVLLAFMTPVISAQRSLILWALEVQQALPEQALAVETAGRELTLRSEMRGPLSPCKQDTVVEVVLEALLLLQALVVVEARDLLGQAAMLLAQPLEQQAQTAA